VTVRLVPLEPRPQPLERVLWRLEGVRLRIVCLARDYPHGTDPLLQGDELVQTRLILTGTADVDVTAAGWKRVLLAKGWTELADEHRT